MASRVATCRKSILADAVSFKHSCWASVSQDAKDWITACLTRDHKQRPTAAAALQHRWLTTAHEDEARAAPLAAHVVARMQHFARRWRPARRSLACLLAEQTPLHIWVPGMASHDSSKDGATVVTTYLAAHAASDPVTSHIPSAAMIQRRARVQGRAAAQHPAADCKRAFGSPASGRRQQSGHAHLSRRCSARHLACRVSCVVRAAGQRQPRRSLCEGGRGTRGMAGPHPPAWRKACCR